MLWIRFIKVVLVTAILLVVLVLGVEFSTLHTNPVTVNYLMGTATMPLSLLVICAFAAGVALTGLVGMFVVLPLRWQAARLRQAASSKDQEISLLSKKIGRDAH
ncbi:MAG: LapA family protein [Candidatus Competibacter sp.]|nr:LapA family protein [Candidatus Competibacter sp.]HRD50438.1 LapA family protein [Candidatus Contendobacter sp.]